MAQGVKFQQKLFLFFFFCVFKSRNRTPYQDAFLQIKTCSCTTATIASPPPPPPNPPRYICLVTGSETKTKTPTRTLLHRQPTHVTRVSRGIIRLSVLLMAYTWTSVLTRTKRKSTENKEKEDKMFCKRKRNGGRQKCGDRWRCTCAHLLKLNFHCDIENNRTANIGQSLTSV